MKDTVLPNAKIQFDLVFSKGKSWTGREIVLRALPNNLESSRFGYVVSRRVGKAVVRNRIKRRLREITRRIAVKPGWDIIFIARIPAAAAGYKQLGSSAGKLLLQADLCVEGNESNSAGTN